MKNKKILILASVVIIIGAASGIFYLYKKQQAHNAAQPDTGIRKPNSVDYGPPKPTDKIQPSAKDEIIDGNSGSSQATNATLTITQAVQQDSTIYIRTIINGFNGGDCALKISKGTLVIQKTAPIGVQASYAVCQGFNIPASEFSESGTWNVSITATGTEGKQVTGTAMLEVKK